MRRITYTIPAECDGWLVAQVVRQRLGVSERSLRRAKSVDGAFLLDGESVWSVAVVHQGQQLAFGISDEEMRRAESVIAPEPGPLDIVYEDDDLLVINKPAGTVVHPSPGHDGGTLANFVMHHLQQRGLVCNIHPVQRLDVGTSGLVVFATSGYVHKRLDDMMHSQQFCREYLAICEGAVPEEGTVDAPWARLTRAPSTFGVDPSGKRAVTHFSALKTWAVDERHRSLVRLRLETGRTHQIRIHMAHIGHPLTGDETYGVADVRIQRPALHSWRLRLEHPITGDVLELEASMPADMQELVRE